MATRKTLNNMAGVARTPKKLNNAAGKLASSQLKSNLGGLKGTQKKRGR